MAMPPVDDSVLKPGTGIDLVRNLHSLTPVSSASVIFEADPKKRCLLVAATGASHRAPQEGADQLHVSTMVRTPSGDKERVGFPCQVLKVIPDYRLSNGNSTQALVLRYAPTPEDANVRSAFRYTPTATHEVLGKLVIAEHEFFSGNHFRICDISTSGVGFVIPRLLGKTKNPMAALESGRIARLGLVLRDHSGKKEQLHTVNTALAVVRVNRRYTDLALFAGCRFTRLKDRDEEVLSHFIHNAQLHEIRSLTHT